MLSCSALPKFSGRLLRAEPRLREANDADGNRLGHHRENVGASDQVHGLDSGPGRVRRPA